MKWAGDETDLARGQGQLAEFEGALALLQAEPGLAKDRIVLVGHDYGAMFGLVLAAENPDIRAMVFLAFAPRYSDWKDFFNPRKKLTPAVYDGIMAPLDPMAALDKLRGRPLFLQFAKSDTYVSEETVAAIRAAAGAGPVFDVVDAPDTDHENLHKKGAEVRLAWMENQLFAP
jgi:pimeloyl-ACP methyl ester carboxylesterase